MRMSELLHMIATFGFRRVCVILVVQSLGMIWKKAFSHLVPNWANIHPLMAGEITARQGLRVSGVLQRGSAGDWGTKFRVVLGQLLQPWGFPRNGGTPK